MEHFAATSLHLLVAKGPFCALVDLLVPAKYTALTLRCYTAHVAWLPRQQLFKILR